MLKLLSAFALAGLIATTAGCIYYDHDRGYDRGYDRGWDNDRHSHHDRSRDDDRDDRYHRKGRYR